MPINCSSLDTTSFLKADSLGFILSNGCSVRPMRTVPLEKFFTMKPAKHNKKTPRTVFTESNLPSVSLHGGPPGPLWQNRDRCVFSPSSPGVSINRVPLSKESFRFISLSLSLSLLSPFLSFSLSLSFSWRFCKSLPCLVTMFIRKPHWLFYYFSSRDYILSRL